MLKFVFEKIVVDKSDLFLIVIINFIKEEISVDLTQMKYKFYKVQNESCQY